MSELRGDGKFIGLYFSASWCAPCHSFTPKLVDAYSKVRAAGHRLEVIYVSSDKSTPEFVEYFGQMPWAAIPQGDRRKEILSTLFSVEGIPTLVIVDASTGEVVTKQARTAVLADPEGADFPWRPKLVGDLASPDGINDEASLCVMVEGCTEAERAAAREALTALAEASRSEGSTMLFFIAATSDATVEQAWRPRVISLLVCMPPPR